MNKILRKGKSKTLNAHDKRRSLMPGMIEAVEEIRQHLLGKKKLPNADEPLKGTRKKA